MTIQPLSLNLNKNEDSLEFLEDEVFDISEFLIDQTKGYIERVGAQGL